MAYSFRGLLVVGPSPKPKGLPEGALWRSISLPVRGFVVSLPDTLGQGMEIELIRALGAEVAGENDWIFLNYQTWAGKIDSIFGLGTIGGGIFGPIEDSEDDTVEITYKELMERIGIMPEYSGNFAPFHRDYFGV